MNPQVKEISKEEPRNVCMYCQKSEINSLEWGPMYNLAGVTVHYFCMLFSAGLSQNGDDDEGILGFLPIDIRKELKRGEKLKCKFCKLPRATIGCSVKNCKSSYHYPCGLNKKCVFHFIGNFESYCAQHKESVHIPLDKSEWDCPICFNPVDDEEIPVWPPCCQKKVFHKRCIMEMAKNHGAHFFKCPLCNDRDIFSVAMRRAGVYLPDRDATWESDPNAFAEHTRLYNKCDAPECQCPKGREYSSKSESKPWKVIRCGACGAFGIHRRCGNLKNLTWRCQLCANILSEKRRNESMNSSRIQRHQYDLSDEEEMEGESNIIGIKEVITEAPEIESCTSTDSNSEDDTKRASVRTVYAALHGRVVLKDVSGSESSEDEYSSSSADDDSSNEVYIQANSRLRRKLESKTLSPSTTTSGSNEGDFATTDNVSNPVQTDPSGNVVSLPPVGRDKLIKVDGRKKIEGQVLLEPKPEVLSESPSRSVKISLQGNASRKNNETTSSSQLNSRKKCTAEAELNEYNEAKTKIESLSVPRDEKTDDVVVNNQASGKHKETCITLDDDEDSDLEILSEKVKPTPCTKSTAFLEMVNERRGRKPAQTAPVVRLGVDDDQNDDIEFISTVDHPKPTITFSSFRQPSVAFPSVIAGAFLRVINSSAGPSASKAHYSGSLSRVLQKNMQSGSDRNVATATVELSSDDEDTTTSPRGANKGVSKSTKCSKKRERLSPTDVTHTTASHSKRHRT